jgi:hypothetical protein
MGSRTRASKISIETYNRNGCDIFRTGYNHPSGMGEFFNRYIHLNNPAQNTQPFRQVVTVVPADYYS